MSNTPINSLIKDRKTIENQDKWDLSSIFRSIEDWEKSRDRLKAEIKNTEKYKGKVMSSASALAGTLIFVSGLQKN